MIRILWTSDKNDEFVKHSHFQLINFLAFVAFHPEDPWWISSMSFRKGAITMDWCPLDLSSAPMETPGPRTQHCRSVAWGMANGYDSNIHRTHSNTCKLWSIISLWGIYKAIYGYILGIDINHFACYLMLSSVHVDFEVLFKAMQRFSIGHV